jgi:hypothetical protein
LDWESPLSSNAQLLLEGIIAQRQAVLAPKMSKNDFFQLFCLSETLKGYDLSIDELQDASVDGGNDGGIDAIFIFVDDDPLTAKYQLRPRQEAVLELLIVQCKDTSSFSGTAIDKLVSTIGTLFDYSRSMRVWRTHTTRSSWKRRACLGNFMSGTSPISLA